MKKTLILLLAFAILSGLFTACGTQEANESSPKYGEEIRIVEDCLGRQVEVPGVVDSIVALGNTPRMITYLGLADRVVGLSGMQDPQSITPFIAYAYANKELWAALPSTGTDATGNTDYYPEVIISVKPDVVFCSYTEDIVEDIERKTGIPVVAVPMGTLFAEDYEQGLRIIAEVCGIEEKAEDLISYINTSLQDLNDRTADLDSPKVLAAAATFKGTHGIEGVRVKDPLLTALNAENVAAGITEAEAAVVDKEQIIAWNPEFIFFDSGGMELVNLDYKDNPRYYEKLSAYQNERLYQYPSATSYFANVEISLANCYYVGSLLYPEKFEDINIEEKANEIFKFFLGSDDYLSVLEEFEAGYSEVKLG